MPLRIVLADDHAALRRCFRGALEREPGFTIVKEASGGNEALAAVEACAPCLPDLVLLDMELRDLDGLVVARRLLARWPALRILVLSWHDDLPLIRAAAAAGCFGYVLKDDPAVELIDAIRKVAAGGHHLSSAVRRAQTSGDPISAFC